MRKVVATHRHTTQTNNQTLNTPANMRATILSRSRHAATCAGSAGAERLHMHVLCCLMITTFDSINSGKRFIAKLFRELESVPTNLM
jgi:hypothetical protein